MHGFAEMPSAFSKGYELPSDRRAPSAVEFVSGVVDVYKPKRKFKKYATPTCALGWLSAQLS